MKRTRGVLSQEPWPYRDEDLASLQDVCRSDPVEVIVHPVQSAEGVNFSSASVMFVQQEFLSEGRYPPPTAPDTVTMKKGSKLAPIVPRRVVPNPHPPIKTKVLCARVGHADDTVNANNSTVGLG